MRPELGALKARLLAMGGLAEDHLRRAMRGLVERNHQLLADVIAGDSVSTICRSRSTIVLHAARPASACRASISGRIVSAPRINADLERVGDLAVNIAEAGQRYLRIRLSNR